jgi:hypothetical protein
MRVQDITKPRRHANRASVEIALGVALLAFGPNGCTSKESAQASLQSYCDIAIKSIEDRTVFTKSGLLDAGAIFSIWNEKNPSEAVREVLNKFYTKEHDITISNNPDDLTLEDYREMMADSSSIVELEPPRCDVLLTALMETNRRAARLNYVDEVCLEYDRLRAVRVDGRLAPSQHDEILRTALKKVSAEARHVNASGKAFIEALLAVEPPLRGKTFARDFAKWQGRVAEFGDPCRDLILDVEQLYESHMEKQGKEAP